MRYFCLTFLVLCHVLGVSQVITPDSARLYNLTELSDIFPENILMNDNNNNVVILSDFTLSETDSLVIGDTDTLFLAENIFLDILGHVEISNLVITKLPDKGRYGGINIDYVEGNKIHSVTFEEGNGIFVRSIQISFDSCTFKNNGHDYRSGALTLSNSNAEIKNCLFRNNSRSGINSAANGNASPLIDRCIFEANNSSNGNFPQINLGVSNQSFPDLPIRITNCEIIGEHTMAGGIAVTNLLGQGFSHSIISDCKIENNRYGIAQLGGGIHGEFVRNNIINNNIEINPFTGGSGLNFQGPSTNTADVSENFIEGNLWGVTILSQAKPNFGRLDEDGNQGLNTFNNNGNDGELFAIYNNTPDSIWAQNNIWSLDANAGTEDVVFHKVDDETLGVVIFDPEFDPTNSSSNNYEELSFKISPNPVTLGTDLELFIPKQLNNNYNIVIKWINTAGVIVSRNTMGLSNKISIPNKIPPGLYYLQINDFKPSPLLILP